MRFSSEPDFADFRERMQNQKLVAAVVAGGRWPRFVSKSRAGINDPGSKLSANAQYLSPFIVTAGWTSCVRGDRASALGALIQLRGLPAMRCLSGAQSHFRSFAFGDSHSERVGKQGFGKRQGGGDSGVQVSGEDGDVPDPWTALLQLQLIQRAPIRRAFTGRLGSRRQSGFGGTFPPAFPIAMRMGRQV